MIPNCPQSARIPVRPMPEQDPEPAASVVLGVLSHWRQWLACDYGTQVYEKQKLLRKSLLFGSSRAVPREYDMRPLNPTP